MVSIAHGSTVEEKIDLHVEILLAVSSDYDLSEYCCSLDLREFLFYQ